MAKIEWTRTDPNDIEAVVGILLCREYVHATRIKPSQGDGGIDVLVPRSDGNLVYQVKGFTENIGPTQKSQIRKSWRRFVEYKDNLKDNVVGWHLVTPRNPTKEQIRWLDDVTNHAGTPCTWLGLDFIEGLVAKFPEVVDYYLHDGRERLDEVMSRYLALTSYPNPAQPPAESVATIERIHKALNDFDPHFLYDFSVQTVTPDRPVPDLAKERAAAEQVFSAQSVVGDRCITYRIFTKFDAALKERPTPGRFTLQAERGTEDADQIEDWIKFGTPLTNAYATNVQIGLPGGFEQPAHDSLISISPTMPDGAPPVDVTLKTIESDSTVVEELDFTTKEVTAGFDRQGLRAVGTDTVLGAARFELRFHQSDKTFMLNVAAGPMDGHPPADVLRVLRFLASIRPPRLLQLAVRNGPPFGGATAIPKAMLDSSNVELVMNVCKSLATIQEHTFERIVVPDLSTSTLEEMLAWSDAARMLRGEAIDGAWSEMHFHTYPDVLIPQVEGHGLITRPLLAHIGGREIQLGWTVTHFATMQLDGSRPPLQHEDHLDFWAVPGDDDTVTSRYTGRDDISRPATST
jgi:hypothetical protein